MSVEDQIQDLLYEAYSNQPERDYCECCEEALRNVMCGYQERLIELDEDDET